MGLDFWREVPDLEMNDWFDWENVTDALQCHEKNDQDESKNSCSSSGKESNRFVRQNSIESIQKMTESLHLHTETVPDGIENYLYLAHDEMVHARTKLELIAVRERYWGRYLGSLLVACALYNARYKFDQSMVVLHIAGGEENACAKTIICTIWVSSSLSQT